MCLTLAPHVSDLITPRVSLTLAPHVSDLIPARVSPCQAFGEELEKRAAGVESVRQAARDTVGRGDGGGGAGWSDTTPQQTQLIELTTRWQHVCKLSAAKQERLDQALEQVTATDRQQHLVPNSCHDVVYDYNYITFNNIIYNNINKHIIYNKTIFNNIICNQIIYYNIE